MWENGGKNEENAEKDDSGRSDDNTTTIEFTNPTVSQSVQMFKTPTGYPWPSRTPLSLHSPEARTV